jgi:glutathione peroxidase
MLIKKPRRACYLITLLALLGVFLTPSHCLLAAFDPGVHQFKVKDIKSRTVDMASYRDKVLLIVNTASFCGYTSQYKALQKTYEQFKDRGFLVLGFPSNDFGRQEPGSNKEIKDFCELNFKVSFPLFSKVVVAGAQKAPLFKYLTEDAGPEFKRSIDWNFEKFLIGKNGRLIARFKSSVDPQSEEMVVAISTALKAKNDQPSANKALPTAKPDK